MVIRPTVVLAAAPLPVPQGRTMARALTAPLSPVGWPTIRSASCPLTALWATCPTTIPLTTCPLLILSMTCPLLLTVKACRLWCANTRSGCVVRRWRGMRSCGRGGSTRTRGLAWTRGRVGGWARALVALVVLVVVAVSVGAYVVFLRGEPDYGMSHGYQVQSDGSLKRPPVTDKAPDKPAEMTKGDEAGAAAAARYYLNAYSYAWNTGDTVPIKAISDEECAFCRREIAQIDEFYSNGYWAKGTYASITNTDSIDRVSDDATDAAIYDVQFHIDEHTPEGYSSKGYESGSRYDTIIKFRVQWKENEWRVVDGRAADADAVS